MVIDLDSSARILANAGGLLALTGLWGAFAPAAWTASHPQIPTKTLRVTFAVAETGFEPARTNDYYSGAVIEAIYDRLLTYDYLARPSKLVPLAAESLPQITGSGKIYTFKIRKGIYFTPDPAFKGKRRELTAEDYAYSIKRFFDPRYRSPYAFLFEGKIVGLDELGARARKAGRLAYEAEVPGLEGTER